MTWIKLDDNAVDHPKVAGLSDKAFRAWIRSISYASRFLTDGVLPIPFLATVAKKTQEELFLAGLWISNDKVAVKNYLEHQKSREAVEDERQRNRDKRKGVPEKNHGTTVGTPDGRTGERPPPDSREQIADAEVPTEVPTEIRLEQRRSNLVKSHKDREHRLQYCAFVGSKIEVPKNLHAEWLRSHGGANPERSLQAWYLELDEAAELGAWRVPNDTGIYKWLKGHYAQKFPVTLNGAKSFNDELDEWARS